MSVLSETVAVTAGAGDCGGMATNSPVDEPRHPTSRPSPSCLLRPIARETESTSHPAIAPRCARRVARTARHRHRRRCRSCGECGLRRSWLGPFAGASVTVERPPARIVQTRHHLRTISPHHLRHAPSQCVDPYALRSVVRLDLRVRRRDRAPFDDPRSLLMMLHRRLRDASPPLARCFATRRAMWSWRRGRRSTVALRR